jgi:hypothetical protein
MSRAQAQQFSKGSSHKKQVVVFIKISFDWIASEQKLLAMTTKRDIIFSLIKSVGYYVLFYIDTSDFIAHVSNISLAN